MSAGLDILERPAPKSVLPPALVLNADFTPLTTHPLSVWAWEDVIRAVITGTVDIVAEHDAVVRSPGFQMQLPSVIALRKYVKNDRPPAFTRFNLFLRDNFCCQYCRTEFRSRDLTFDHVIPRSKGGGTGWDNVVAACRDCNERKGNKMPKQCHMFPAATPRQPSAYELRRNGLRLPPNYLHESWVDYLYWDGVLETEEDNGAAQPATRARSTK